MRRIASIWILTLGLSSLTALTSGCEIKDLYVFEQMRNERREKTRRPRPDERPLGEAPRTQPAPSETVVVDGGTKHQPVVFLTPKPGERYAGGQPELQWSIDPELGGIESVRLDIYPLGLERPYYMWIGEGRRTGHVIGDSSEGAITWYFYYGEENNALPAGAYVAKVLIEGKRTISAKTDFIIDPETDSGTMPPDPERK